MRIGLTPPRHIHIVVALAVEYYSQENVALSCCRDVSSQAAPAGPMPQPGWYAKSMPGRVSSRAAPARPMPPAHPSTSPRVPFHPVLDAAPLSPITSIVSKVSSQWPVNAGGTGHLGEARDRVLGFKPPRWHRLEQYPQHTFPPAPSRPGTLFPPTGTQHFYLHAW